MGKTIAFLVIKPAQFDVPFFKFIASQPPGDWRFMVIYLENPLQTLHDPELKTSSDWGINLTDGYEWHCLAHATAATIEALYTTLNIQLLISNGYQKGYAPFIAAARSLKIPVGLRIDSVLTGKSMASLLMRKLLMRWTYRHFKGFFTTGKMGYTYLDYIGVSRKKQFWFPYCSDNDFFRGNSSPQALSHLYGQYQLSTAKPLVLGVCKFIARENPADLLSAFIALNNVDVQLVMIGDGQQAASLREKAAQFPHLSICFPGYVPYTTLPHWYHIASVFVHPAQDEPWGVSVQEALAAGCRVIASDKVGSAYDLIVSGKNGFIYPVNHPTILAADLKKALALPKNTVAETNNQVLRKWNYHEVWLHLQQAASTITATSTH